NDAECDAGLAADDDDLADRVAGDAHRAPSALGEPGRAEREGAKPHRECRGPVGRDDAAILVFDRDQAGADQLDAVPGDPVSWLAAQALNPESIRKARRAVDRAGGEKVGELVG